MFGGMFDSIKNILNNSVFQMALNIACFIPMLAPFAIALKVATAAMNTLDQGQEATDQLTREDKMPELVASNITKVLGGLRSMSTVTA